jgi:hypothetical protein
MYEDRTHRRKKIFSTVEVGGLFVTGMVAWHAQGTWFLVLALSHMALLAVLGWLIRGELESGVGSRVTDMGHMHTLIGVMAALRGFEHSTEEFLPAVGAALVTTIIGLVLGRKINLAGQAVRDEAGRLAAEEALAWDAEDLEPRDLEEMKLALMKLIVNAIQELKQLPALLTEITASVGTANTSAKTLASTLDGSSGHFRSISSNAAGAATSLERLVELKERLDLLLSKWMSSGQQRAPYRRGERP